MREELFFISLGKGFHNLAAKFETLSILYCVVRMFFRAKRLPLPKFHFLEKQIFIS